MSNGGTIGGIPHNPRKGMGFQTYTGGVFFPLDPKPEEVNIEDIARALSHVCRYGGHIRKFYSVAQHSVYVAQLCRDKWLKGWFLLHDAPEAYMGDVVRPLKKDVFFGEQSYTQKENELMDVIAQALHLPVPYPDPEKMWADIHDADNAVLLAEKRDLIGTINDVVWKAWQYNHITPYIQVIEPWDPDTAMEIFLDEYRSWKSYIECAKSPFSNFM